MASDHLVITLQYKALTGFLGIRGPSPVTWDLNCLNRVVDVKLQDEIYDYFNT